MSRSLQVIDGWTVLDELGSGDFAVVFKVVGAPGAGRDPPDEFALKLCTADNRAARDRLQREDAALRQLDHPSIPRLVSTGSYQDRPYLVMSLAHGRTLSELARAAERTGALQGDIRATEILRQLLHAVAHVHGSGLVHRDIKEANVLTTSSGSHLALIDFGFCKAAGGSEIISGDSFFRAGAALFSPPSKLSRPGAAVEAHDVFAVGVIGYRLLTGEYPWSVGPTEAVDALRDLQLSTRLVPVNEKNPNVRTPVSNLVSKLLEIRDEERPSAVEAFAETDHILATIRSAPSRPPTPPARIAFPHVTRDALYGDVRLTDLEQRALDTREMQRLRFIKQLGLTHYVYCGAEHTRLAHSIGCVARVEQILRTIEDRDGIRIDDELRLVSRLYALTHDVTHIPYGHTLEDEFGFFRRHDDNPARAQRLIFDPGSELGNLLNSNEIGRAVRVLFDPDVPRPPVGAVTDLVSGLTGADVLDYIDRDAIYCGIDHRIDSAIFRQFQLQPLRRNEDQRRLVSLIWGRYGLRFDRELAVESVVQQRYAMFSKVYTHRTKIEASTLLAKGLSEAIRPLGQGRPSLREESLEQLGVADAVVLEWMRSSRRPAVKQAAEQLLHRALPTGVYRATLLGGDRSDWTRSKYDDRRLILRDEGLLDPGTRAEIERALADAARLRSGDVMIYCPARAPGHKRVEYWASTLPGSDTGEARADVRQRSRHTAPRSMADVGVRGGWGQREQTVSGCRSCAGPIRLPERDRRSLAAGTALVGVGNEAMVGIAEVVSFLGGVTAGLLTNALWDMRFALRRRMARMLEFRDRSGGFEPASVDLYPINRWSPGRTLERHGLRMAVCPDRPAQVWCDQDEWQRLSDTFARHYSGKIAYLVDFRIDHRESEHGTHFDYTVAPCDYFEYLATERYLHQHPDTVAGIRAMLAAGRLAEFARNAPPGLIKINVSVLTSGNRFLALQRSGAVHAKRGQWTVGPNETMRLVEEAVPGSRPENLFDLAERCLREELGIESSDYQSLTVSWIGYEPSTTSVKVFAQAYTDLPERRIAEAVEGAHGAFEVQQLAWLPFNRRMLADIIRNWRTGDSAGRVWSASASLALTELWRMRSKLQDGS